MIIKYFVSDACNQKLSIIIIDNKQLNMQQNRNATIYWKFFSRFLARYSTEKTCSTMQPYRYLYFVAKRSDGIILLRSNMKYTNFYNFIQKMSHSFWRNIDCENKKDSNRILLKYDVKCLVRLESEQKEREFYGHNLSISHCNKVYSNKAKSLWFLDL